MKNNSTFAIEIINLKIAKEIKENKEKDFQTFKEKILNLKDERDKIYEGNEEIINKVINNYLMEVEEKNDDK